MNFNCRRKVQVKQQILMAVPLTAEFGDFFKSKPQLKMPNLGHDAAGRAANAAYFGAFLVKGN
jgi:hypothetical protein